MENHVEGIETSYQLDYTSDLQTLHSLLQKGANTDDKLEKVLDILTDETNVRRQGVSRLLIGIAEKATENRAMMVQAAKGMVAVKRGIESRNLALANAQMENDREERITVQVLQALQATMERRIPGSVVFEQSAPIDGLKERLEARLIEIAPNEMDMDLRPGDRICDSHGVVHVVDDDGLVSETGEQAIVQDDGVNAVLEGTGEVIPIYDIEE